MIRFPCPTCHRAYELGDEHAGRSYCCLGCKQVIEVPPPRVALPPRRQRFDRDDEDDLPPPRRRSSGNAEQAVLATMWAFFILWTGGQVLHHWSISGVYAIQQAGSAGSTLVNIVGAFVVCFAIDRLIRISNNR